MSGDAMRIDHRGLLGALVVEPDGVLDAASYGALRTVLVKAAVDEPRAAIVDLERRAVPARPALARRFVLDVCSDWPVGPRVREAVVIANELVENTLLHTYSAPMLRLELRRGMLTIAVYDDNPAMPGFV